jgi:hypothetical protein
LQPGLHFLICFGYLYFCFFLLLHLNNAYAIDWYLFCGGKEVTIIPLLRFRDEKQVAIVYDKNRVPYQIDFEKMTEVPETITAPNMTDKAVDEGDQSLNVVRRDMMIGKAELAEDVMPTELKNSFTLTTFTSRGADNHSPTRQMRVEFSFGK